MAALDLDHDRRHDGERSPSSRGTDRRTTKDRHRPDLSSWDRYLAALDSHGPHLFRLAFLLRGDRDEAEDLVRELFHHAHAPWRDGRIDDLGTYLRRSLTNRIMANDRRRTVADRIMHRRHTPTTSVGVDDDRAGPDTLPGALARLEADQRSAVVLRYYEGLSIGETAGLLGCDEATVAQRVSDALDLLRPALEAVR